MDSNMRIQVRARKCSLIAAILIVVFILGLMIGIFVYKDRRIGKIESRLNKLERTRITTIEREGERLREEHRNMNKTIEAALNKLRREIETKIEEKIKGEGNSSSLR